MKTLKIAICEDSAEDMELLAKAIEQSLRGRSVAYTLARYAGAGDFLSAFRKDAVDILFMDMYLGEGLGIDVCEQVRRQDEDCCIVFVTASPDFALEGYRVNAAHYLLKPVTASGLGEVWRRCAQTARKPDTVTLMIDRKPMGIAAEDILYIEADDKRCLIHTAAGTLASRVSIDQMEYMLPAGPFCRCHRGYIVNFRHVRQAGEDFTMDNGDSVYIRQAELRRVIALYEQFRSGGAAP